MKRIVTIQDISCIGKCSLTVALPVISAMGVETAVIPTAVLSSHSVFPDFTFRDMTEEIAPITRHWETQQLRFDAIYTGYLGSEEQIDVIEQVVERFKTPENLIFVDPAMADQGKMYAGFDRAFADKMARLCAKADIIDPNVTEACFLTGTEYRPYQDEGYVQMLLEKLARLGAGTVVLTGVSEQPGHTGVASLDTRTGERFSYSHASQPGQFHGTGDIFSSTVVGGLMRGLSLPEALKLAADFTYTCILATTQDPDRRWYGVSFERALPALIHALEQRDLTGDFSRSLQKIDGTAL